MKTWIILLILVLSIAIMATAEAATCRTVDDHEICIVTIKRSAKNYWEYRAQVRIDGEPKPMQVYDCRSRQTIQANKVLEIFEQDGTAEVVCSFFKPPRDAFGVASGKVRSFRHPDPLEAKTLKSP